jgi:hypothetical protein
MYVSLTLSFPPSYLTCVAEAPGFPGVCVILTESISRTNFPVTDGAFERTAVDRRHGNNVVAVAASTGKFVTRVDCCVVVVRT